MGQGQSSGKGPDGRPIRRANSLPTRAASMRRSVAKAMTRKKDRKSSSADGLNNPQQSNFLNTPGGSSPAMLRSAPGSPSGGGSGTMRVRTQSFVLSGFESSLGMVGHRNEDGVLMRPKKKKEQAKEKKLDKALDWQDSSAFADPETKEIFPTSRNSLQLFDLPEDLSIDEGDDRQTSPTRGKLSNQSSFSRLEQKQDSFVEEEEEEEEVEQVVDRKRNLPIIRQETVDDDDTNDMAWLDNAQDIIQQSCEDTASAPRNILVASEEQRDSGVISDNELIQAEALKQAEDDTQLLMDKYAGKEGEREETTASLLTELDGFIGTMMDGIDV